MSTNTEYALAGAPGPGTPTKDEGGRKELAALEGHDADIHTENQAFSRGSGQDGASDGRTEAPPTSSTPEMVISTKGDPHWSPSTHDRTQSANRELLPSTVAQRKLSNYATNLSSTTHSASPPELGRSTTRTHTPDVLQPMNSEEDFSAVRKQGIPSMTDANSPQITTQTSPESSDNEKGADLEAGRRRNSSSDTEAETSGQNVSNSNIVNWDGPEDPQNPMNWSAKLKWGNIAVVSVVTFLTPLASSMFAPGIPQVMREFKSTNEELGSFSVSVYVLGYAFGPLLVAPLSELYGRLPVYHVCNIFFVILTIACALATNLNMLIGFRFVEGLFGSCPLTIGGGTIADMIPQQRRGGVMAIWALGPLMGPVIGPIAGGYLAQAKGWRWVFWVIAIFGGVISIAAFFFLRETYPPILLERKAAKLRKATGNTFLESKLKSPLTPAALFKISIVRPIRMLVFSPIVLALSTYMAVGYGYLYLLFTTITVVYESQYNFNQGSVGLTYLGIGIGSLFGVIIFAFVSDRIVKAKSGKGEMKPEYRLPPMMVGSFVIPIGLFMYGWTAEKHIFWIAPIIGTGLVGLGLLATFMPIQTYLVDAFTIHAASALAANTVLRSLLGALLPLAGQKMYATLGLGWGNSLLATIALAMCPIPWIFYRYGERIRKSPKFQQDW